MFKMFNISAVWGPHLSSQTSLAYAVSSRPAWARLILLLHSPLLKERKDKACKHAWPSLMLPAATEHDKDSSEEITY